MEPQLSTAVPITIAVLVVGTLGYLAGWRARDEVAEADDAARAAKTPGISDPTVSLNDYAAICHGASKSAGWWTNLETGASLLPTRNHGELFMLMVSEIAEAMEGKRKNLMDDKLPHRTMVEVELADCLIRIFDYSGAYGLDLEGAVREKLAFNAVRPDHKPENRRKDDGKKF